ncbi:hypothetical protein OpiT1DRAFT_04465 [Opitutaceae bacterium TAV1]|nr:hypothetical protein OpiT1DRAFT_04465 [Opitutaceae bacterium TAV1]
MKATRIFSRRPQAGFSLFEVVVILIVLSILVGISAYPMIGVIDSTRMRAEREKLASIANEIRSTFHNDALDTHNISAIPGEVSDSCPVTLFDTLAQDPAADLVNANSWFTRLARLRSGTVLTGGPVYAASLDVRDLTLNHFKRRRLLILGPPDEDDHQRYILLSFMIPESTTATLTMPAPTNTNLFSTEYKTWFDTIYHHDWGEVGNAPAGWGGNWGDETLHGYTFAQRVLAERIVQRRFLLTVNNQGTDAIGAYTNLRSYTAVDANDTLRDKVNAGVIKQDFPKGTIETVNSITRTRTRGVLEGRRLLIYTLTSNDIERRKSLLFSFQMNETTVVTANSQ